MTMIALQSSLESHLPGALPSPITSPPTVCGIVCREFVFLKPECSKHPEAHTPAKNSLYLTFFIWKASSFQWNKQMNKESSHHQLFLRNVGPDLYKSLILLISLLDLACKFQLFSLEWCIRARFHTKSKAPVNIPADGLGTQNGPRFLPHVFPQDIHTFPKVACTYADSEGNCPCNRGPWQPWSLMVSHMALTNRSGERDSHSWPALRDRAGPLGLWRAFCFPRTAGSHPQPGLLRRAAPEGASIWQLRASLSTVLQACGSHS